MSKKDFARLAIYYFLGAVVLLIIAIVWGEQPWSPIPLVLSLIFYLLSSAMLGQLLYMHFWER